MSGRGMIIRERTEAVLTRVIRDGFAQMPRATWMTVDELAAGSQGLERRDDGRYEVVTLGATVSADDIRNVAFDVMGDVKDVGLRVSFDRARGFAVYDLAG